MTESIKLQNLVVKSIVLLVLSIGTVLVLLPVIWMLSTSLKSPRATTQMPPQWIPHDPVMAEIDGRDRYVYAIPVDGEIRHLALLKKTGSMGTFVNPDDPTEQYELDVQSGERISVINIHWENYAEAMTKVPFGTYLLNSFKIVLWGTIGTLLSNTIVAYGFARFRAKGLNILFLLLLSTMMLPYQVTLIPSFVLFQKIGWYDTLLPLIVPAFFANAWDTFLLRQYFMSIPLELDDAARIDGCGPLGILWHVIIPQSKPALATIAIFHILWAWNDFFNPLIYLKSQENWTVALGLQSFNALYTKNMHLLMAASAVVMLPSILIFFFAQRLFIQGVVITGIKG